MGWHIQERIHLMTFVPLTLSQALALFGFLVLGLLLAMFLRSHKLFLCSAILVGALLLIHFLPPVVTFLAHL
jgi:hypothetical protein